MRHRLTLILLSLVLALGLPAGALADEGGRSGDNAAVAINTKDGSSLFRLAFDITRVAGDIVDNANAAVAYSSCESCRTTAIAIQIVLVTGSPSTVTPQNIAVAVNDQCTLCETFASAYQFVIGTGGPVTFTKDGRKELKDIRRELKALGREDLSPEELDARVSAIVDRLRVVLDTQLVPARDHEDEEDEDERDEQRENLDEGERPTTTSTVETEETETATVTTPTDTTTTAPAETETAPTETGPAETETETETTP